MKEITLLLYLHDVDYGKRLLRYLTGKKNPLLYPELVTSKDHLKEKEVSGEGNLVVLTDDAGIGEDSKRKVIRLSKRKDHDKTSIYLYQKASGIYRELLEILELSGTVDELRPGDSGIGHGVFYLLHAEGSGAEGPVLAQYLGERGRCLYLGLNRFPCFYTGSPENPPDFSARGMDRLMFGAATEEFAQRVQDICVSFGQADMIPPFPHYRDLLDCKAEDWESVVSKLRSDCGYDSIVIESDALWEYSLDLMDHSDYPIFLSKRDLCGKIRHAVFTRYCSMEGRESLIRRCRGLPPLFSAGEGEEILAQKSLQEIGEDESIRQRVEDWFQNNGEGAEEDDCIIECDEG